MRGVCGRNWGVGPKIWWQVGLKTNMRWEVGFVGGGTLQKWWEVGHQNRGEVGSSDLASHPSQVATAWELLQHPAKIGGDKLTWGKIL